MRGEDFVGPTQGRLVPISFGDKGGRSTLAFVPADLPPAVDRDQFVGRLSDELIEAERPLARLATRAGTLPAPTLLLRSLRRREAQQSSIIEDTTATTEELALAGIEESAPRAEVVEVRNNVLTIEMGLGDPRPVSLNLLRDMHRTLMAGARGQEQQPGEFRSCQVQIGGERHRPDLAKYLPPPPGPELDSCLRAYERFLHPDATGSAPRARFPDLIELAFNHYQFEAIHPFRDGNGRLGRAIINIHPCKSGWLKQPVLNVSASIERDRENYYERLLRVSTRGEWVEWVRFFLRVVAEQSADDLARAEALHAVREKCKARFADESSSGQTSRLVDLVFERMGVTTSIVAQHLGVSQPTAQKHVERLRQAGFLEEITKRQWGRVYFARRLSEILDAPDGDTSRRLAESF